MANKKTVYDAANVPERGVAYVDEAGTRYFVFYVDTVEVRVAPEGSGKEESISFAEFNRRFSKEEVTDA